jgi:glycosyltransferase involved in cell wall biosynthesis
MRRKTVGLFTPYLNTLGGGEKHILSILKVFDTAGYNVVVFWNQDLSQEFKSRLKLEFQHLTFAKDLRNQNIIEKSKLLSPLEWLFYVTDGSYFFSPAKRTAVFCMVPDRKLYHMTPINMLKTTNVRFISNSHFTQSHLHAWGINSTVVYPFVSDELFQHVMPVKKPLILSVGRFFSHLHSKKHEEVIKAFLAFHSQFPDFRLVLAGGVAPEDQHIVDDLRNHYPQPSISIETNISFARLQELYKEALVYWHFTGSGVDERLHPEQVEHLGMTPLEAMASQAVPFCFNAGGPRELIEHKKNGFLFSSSDELIKEMNYFLSSPQLQRAMQENAYSFAKKTFSQHVFERHVTTIFSIKS